MKAIIIDRYGGPSALRFGDRDQPPAGDGQVVVRVAATSVNPLDINRASGMLKANFPLTFPFVPGGDFSGVVTAVGAGVDGFKVGQPVYGNAIEGGAYAEYIAVGAGKIAAKPAGLTDAEAASLALVGQTAMQAVAAAGLKDGQTVLVHGLGGAIGAVVLDLLRDRPVTVIGTASARDRDRLIQEGAVQVIDRDGRFEHDVGQVDAVIDGVGRDVQARSWAVIKAGGILVALNQPPDMDAAKGRGVRAIMLLTDTTTESLDSLSEAIGSGVVRPRVGVRYPLADAASAWSNVQVDRAKGKTVLDVGVPS